MGSERDGAIWISSYPKSGNTWLRCLLEAYRRNGVLDINDMRITTSDGGLCLLQGVSPTPADKLGFRGEMLIRPAALLGLFSRLPRPILIKTHFANMQPVGLPPCIPEDFTKKAVYVVRDPRSVVLSFSRFFSYSVNLGADAMANTSFTIGGTETFGRQFLSSWSNHVSSWISEKRYPVCVVKYEDLQADPVKGLTGVLEFLDIEVQEPIVKRAVSAAKISKLKKVESEDGFKENSAVGRGAFFNGDTSWQDELGPKWIKRIEKDHGEVMKLLRYL